MDLRTKSLNFRAKNNLTQQELADKLQIGRELIIRIEQGKSVRPVNQRKMELYIDHNQ